MILDLAHSMLSDSKLPAHYWEKVTLTAIYILNMIPSSRYPDRTLFEIRTGNKLDMSYLHPFSCVAYTKVPRLENRNKLEPQLVKTVLIRYFGAGDYKLLEHFTRYIFQF